MRIALCDDDNQITDQLQKYLTQYFEYEKLEVPEFSIFSDGESLLNDPHMIDIVFLDIELTGIDGLHAGKQLKKQNKNIIIFIVTSYMEYLDEAMGFHVFRYISKPIDKQRLLKNFKEALKEYHASIQTFMIETKNNNVTVLSTDIIMVQAYNRKVIIYTTKGNYESIHNFQYWIEKLNASYFYNSHRSYIVNFFYITSFNKDAILLYDGKLIAYLARRKYQLLKKAYLIFLESRR